MSAKFNLDKYYTPKNTVELCVNKVKEVVGVDFDVVVEPSAGGGAFIEAIENTFSGDKVYLDIEPTVDGVAEQDYLTLDVDGFKQKNVLVIGNPPFGTRNTLSVKFFKKSIQYADVIAFILPISQLNNNQQMYEFDLVSSTDLGGLPYTNEVGKERKVHCCFNIYKRPEGELNKKKVYKFKEFEIKEVRHTSKCTRVRESVGRGICAWGAGIGNHTTPDKSYAKEFYFCGDEEIVDFCMSFDWLSVCSSTATPNLVHWQVYEEVLKHFKLTPKQQLPKIEEK